MKWITRAGVKVDRVACPWLITRFIDPQAEFLFVPADQVAAVAAREGATPYDVAGADLGHHGQDCSFDAFCRRYGLWERDPALVLLARIVNGADTDNALWRQPEAWGLKAVAEGFRHLGLADDHAICHRPRRVDRLRRPVRLLPAVHRHEQADRRVRYQRLIPRTAPMNPMTPIGGPAKPHFNLAEKLEFRQNAFDRKRLFETDSLNFNVYCIVPGQENPLHRHPLSDEVLYFVSGTGTCRVGDATHPVVPGDLVFVPTDAPHAIRNTHASENLVCILAQTPLPCEHVPVTGAGNVPTAT